MKKERTVYFDILNILACFAVLALHHNGIVHHYDVHTSAWAQALTFEVLFYWAVPVFFMLTGATLLGYRSKYTTKEFFIKRVSRAFIPFLLWSLILLFHSWIIGTFQFNNIKEIINALLTTKITHGDIYWFFIPLFSLYCVIPVLSLLKDNRNILWYIVIFIFITHSCLPVLFSILGLKYNYSITFPMAGYTLFLILGYLISTTELSKRTRVIIYLLGISSAFLRYFATYYLSISNGKVDKFLFSYMHFHSVFLAVAVFVFIKYQTKISDRLKTNKTIVKLSSCSLGIYLIHKLVMSYELHILNISPDNVYWRWLGMFLTYFICLIIVLTVKRIPVLRYLFP